MASGIAIGLNSVGTPSETVMRLLLPVRVHEMLIPKVAMDSRVALSLMLRFV